jgi:hypothetical protein
MAADFMGVQAAYLKKGVCSPQRHRDHRELKIRKAKKDSVTLCLCGENPVVANVSCAHTV